MQNPYYKITLGTNNYNYIHGTWRTSHTALSSYTASQKDGTYQSTGLQKPTHTIELLLETGVTVSGLSNTAKMLLDNLLYTFGSSRFLPGQTPFTLFIAPDGSTCYVGLVGTLNREPFVEPVMEGKGFEYRVNLTLQEI